MEQFGLGWALGGIALTALVTTVGTWFVTRFQLTHQAQTDKATRLEEIERAGRYIAVRVVTILDPFIIKCCDVVGDDGEWDHEGMRHTKTVTPEIVYPADVDWRCVRPDLMYRILTLPNEIANADRSISAVDELVAGPPDYEEVYEERHYQYAKLGLLALELARDIRNAYGLAQPDYSRWDPRNTLDRAFMSEDEQRKQSAEISRRLLDGYKSGEQTVPFTELPPSS